MRLPRRPSQRELEEHKALQRRVFDEVVPAFDVEQPPEIMERLNRIVKSAGLRRGEAVLDVGTGVGVLIPLILAFNPSRVVACDLSERMLKRVREKHPQVETHCCDIGELRLPDDSVDAVFMNAVFANILDKEGALLNARRMLRRDGRLLISHPLGREEFIRFLSEWRDRYFNLSPTKSKFRSLLSKSGFRMARYVDSDLYLVVARPLTGRRGGA